jgi:hypothetical protein
VASHSYETNTRSPSYIGKWGIWGMLRSPSEKFSDTIYFVKYIGDKSKQSQSRESIPIAHDAELFFFQDKFLFEITPTECNLHTLENNGFYYTPQPYRKTLSGTQQFLVSGNHLFLLDQRHLYSMECIQGVRGIKRTPLITIDGQFEERTIISFDIKDRRFAILTRNGANQEEICVGILIEEKTQSLEDVGSWVKVPGRHKKVQVSNDEIILLRETEAATKDNGIDIKTVRLSPTVELLDKLAITHGIYGLNLLPSMLPNFLSILKPVCSYFESSIQDFIMVKSQSGKQYIISFGDVITVSSIEGKELRFGGKRLDEYLGERPFNIISVHAEYKSNTLAVTWEKDVSNTRSYYVTILSITLDEPVSTIKNPTKIEEREADGFIIIDGSVD